MRALAWYHSDNRSQAKALSAGTASVCTRRRGQRWTMTVNANEPRPTRTGARREFRQCLLAVGELFDHHAGLLVAVLHGRRLHEVRRRAEQRAADATILGDLGAAQG